MKLGKIFCGVLAAVMTLSIAGCGEEKKTTLVMACLLYTSDAADER